MTDLSRLSEACAGIGHKFHPDEVVVPGGHYYTIVQAARSLLAGQDWSVCEPHESKALPDGLMCEWKYIAINTPWIEDETEPCSIVPARLILNQKA